MMALPSSNVQYQCPVMDCRRMKITENALIADVRNAFLVILYLSLGFM